ncbi:MAG TPA: glycosyltransferase family 39 protein, partial [Chloroflexota bacterium]
MSTESDSDATAREQRPRVAYNRDGILIVARPAILQSADRGIRQALEAGRWSLTNADAILLVPILLLSFMLRFDGLRSRGLLYWDEAKFSLEGVRLLSLLPGALGVHAGTLAGKTIGTAKPTHALLIAMSYGLFGIHDYAPLYLDAAASALEVLLLYLIGRRLFSARIGVLGASLLAVSAYDITYARSALSESDANLLFLLGLLVWSTGWHHLDRESWTSRNPLWQSRLPAACIMGAGFTTNYRLIVYIAILVAIDVFALYRGSGSMVAVRALVLWGLGFAVFPLCWQIIGVVASGHGTVLFRSEITRRPTSYFSEALYQLHGGKQSVMRFEPGLYIQWYVTRQGWPALALLALGIVYAMTYRTIRWILPALLVLLPYALYTFAPFVVPRNLDTAVPFSCLLAAAALVVVVDRVQHVRLKTVIVGLLALALVALGAQISTELTA